MKIHIAEAHRYMYNANEIIKTKLKINGDFYSNPKHIRMAGHTAYVGMLMALEPFV